VEMRSVLNSSACGRKASNRHWRKHHCWNKRCPIVYRSSKDEWNCPESQQKLGWSRCRRWTTANGVCWLRELFCRQETGFWQTNSRTDVKLRPNSAGLSLKAVEWMTERWKMKPHHRIEEIILWS
jgi:hypothetical protein